MIEALLAIALCTGSYQLDGVPQTGTASWYSTRSCQREGTSGTMTASGEAYDEDALTCASWDYPFGTQLVVQNWHNKKIVYVRVTDRGPNKRLYRAGRIIDLSKGAFRRIAPLSQGVVPVTVCKVKRKES
jgi:rare lipoprotein A